MTLSRRDFMKVFGVSLASALLTRCKKQDIPTTTPSSDVAKEPPLQTCYAPIAPTPTDTPPTGALPARERLRVYWLSFDELARKVTADSSEENGSSESFRKQLTDDHRAALNEIVAAGKLPATVADLIQEAYDEACYYIWRSTVPMTCYITAGPIYSQESAAVLVQQSETLNQIASQGSIDPETLAKVHTALEHDLAFYALSEADLQALYDRLAESGQPYPLFDDINLELTPEAKAAAHFIIDLLIVK